MNTGKTELLFFRFVGARRAALALAVLALSVGVSLPADAGGCGDEYSRAVDRAKRDIHDWRIRMSNAGQVKNFVNYLEEKDRSVRQHEEAHRDAMCEYAGDVTYYQYRYRGKDYRMAGCVELKASMPDELRYLGAMAPRALYNDELSAADKAIAAEAELRLKASNTAWMRIPMKTATDSDGKRPPVPIQNGHFCRVSDWPALSTPLGNLLMSFSLVLVNEFIGHCFSH